MIRYYPDIFVQQKHINQMEKELGYSSNQKSTAIKSTKKPTKAEIKIEMSNEHWKPMAVDYGNHIMFGPGFMPRTIGGNARQLNYPIKVMVKRYAKCISKYNKVGKRHIQQIRYRKHHPLLGLLKALPARQSWRKVKKLHKRMWFYKGMLQHGLSLADMTDWIYGMCQANPNTISYWYPKLMQGYDKSNHFFKVPKTKIWTLPIEVAQYLQTDYELTNQKSRDAFNKLVFDAFDLDKDKSYFIKTGVFSGKFEFRNCHCTEPLEMGEYFHVINNFAMSVGASTSVDLCVREWIPDVEHRPTIYDGMPLRTEFRSFVDFDHGKVIGIVPYWNPIVMNQVLSRQGKHNPAIMKDYHTYRKCIPSMMKEFNAAVPELHDQISKLIQNVPMHGKWSLDVMKNGSDYYLIDMSRMQDSALTKLLPKYHF